MKQNIHRFVVEDAGLLRLDRWISERLPEHSRSQIQHAIEAGAVLVNELPQPARFKVRPGDRIAVELPDAEPEGLTAEALPLAVVREDEHVIVIDKPAGMVVHPAPGHATGTVAGALLAHCGPSLREVGGENRWGIVHRLDRHTSGLMVAAKTPEAYAGLVAALAVHAVQRRYLALTVTEFPETDGTIDQPIGRRPNDRKRMGVVRDGRPARTHWHVVWQQGAPALTGMALETGRTHQIRVHLQAFGRPVLGDPDYGWTRQRTMHAFNTKGRNILSAQWPQRQMLHAARLAFRHPVNQDEIWDLLSPLPEDMMALLTAFHEDRWEAPCEDWLMAPIEWLEEELAEPDEDDADEAAFEDED